MKLKTIILSAIAVIGMETTAFSIDMARNYHDNNVSYVTVKVA